MTQHVDQVGGTHYSAAFQHWDWAAETGLGYLEGNASKYLARYRKKGGRQDLEKAASYLQKLLTVPGLAPARDRPGYSPERLARFTRSADLTGSREERLIVLIDSWRTEGDLREVLRGIQELINASG